MTHDTYDTCFLKKIVTLIIHLYIKNNFSCPRAREFIENMCHKCHVS